MRRAAIDDTRSPLRGRAAIAILLSVWLGAAGDALAQAPADQAKTLFNVGAQAYEAGQFSAAIQAFQEAYRLSPRPGILFSMAQAHRKQYYVSKSGDHLRAALRHYREYLTKVESGGRRSDAAQAIAELEPLAARDGGGQGQVGAPSFEAKPQTRLMVSSQTAGATIELDGGKPTAVPLIVEIKPGKHALRIKAAGYFDEDREIQVAEGSVAALDIPLRERPGQLSIETSPGAQVSIDGRLAATAPLSNPLEVEPGRHLVTVTRNGYKAFGQEIEVGRGEAKTVSAPLGMTGQRVGSVVLLGAAAAGVVAGGVLAGLAYRQQTIAADIDERRLSGQIKCPGACAELDQYNEAKASRDELRRNAAIVFGGAVAVGVTGLLLFAFDQPALGATAARRDDKPKPASPQREAPAIEVSAVPAIGPGLYGIGVTGRF